MMPARSGIPSEILKRGLADGRGCLFFIGLFNVEVGNDDERFDSD